MTDEEILEITKLNLAITNPVWDVYLNNLIQVSRSAIAREGITLNSASVEDCNLIVMYAAYLFRKRVEDVAPMPRMLRYALNNRVMAEKGAV